MSDSRAQAAADGSPDDLFNAFSFYFQFIDCQSGLSPKPRKVTTRPLTGQAEMSPTPTDHLFNLFAASFQSVRDAGQLV
jgi:hypothetical protein